MIARLAVSAVRNRSAGQGRAQTPASQNFDPTGWKRQEAEAEPPSGPEMRVEKVTKPVAQEVGAEHDE